MVKQIKYPELSLETYQIHWMNAAMYREIGIKKYRKSMPVVGYMLNEKLCDVSGEPEWKDLMNHIDLFFEGLKYAKLDVVEEEDNYRNKEYIFQYEYLGRLFQISVRKMEEEWYFFVWGKEKKKDPLVRAMVYMLIMKPFQVKWMSALEKNKYIRLYMLF